MQFYITPPPRYFCSSLCINPLYSDICTRHTIYTCQYIHPVLKDNVTPTHCPYIACPLSKLWAVPPAFYIVPPIRELSQMPRYSLWYWYCHSKESCVFFLFSSRESTTNSPSDLQCPNKHRNCHSDLSAKLQVMACFPANQVARWQVMMIPANQVGRQKVMTTPDSQSIK